MGLELLRISAIKWGDDKAIILTKKTRLRLSDYATTLGIPFFYEEIWLQNLKTLILSDEIFLVFNMMVDLPHGVPATQTIDDGVSIHNRVPTTHNSNVGIEPHRCYGGLFLQHVGIFGGGASQGWFGEKCDVTYIHHSKDSKMDSEQQQGINL
ncbi:hypothetical protein KI387_035580, partial [Taxus chinensis]